ncbi:cystic fibrosis transmembrane conductance regulator, partial [Parasponia andersonii]
WWVFSLGSLSAELAIEEARVEREVVAPASDTTGAPIAAASPHGIEVAVEFKPVEHPNEPLDNDRPIQCPLPEPSILNDGRIWKEQVSATVRRRGDLPVMKEGESLEAEDAGTKPKSTQTQVNRRILPSLSAPEHDLLNLLEECNASGI